jgi:SAM-dependent methyltransferase
MRIIDADALKKFSFHVWQYKMGEAVALMIHLGDRLGLYRALDVEAWMTPVEVATTTGLDSRMVLEWLRGQAAAGLIERNGDDTYRLSPEGRLVLAADGELAFAAGAFDGGESHENIDAIAGAFETGAGFTYGDLGGRSARQIDRMNGAWLSRFLPDTVLPLLDGVADRLEVGADVADVGCGGAIALAALAGRFPASRFVGFDPSAAAVTEGRARVAQLENAEVRLAFGEDLPAEPSFDLVMTLDCMHDMPHPDRVAGAIKRTLRPDGVWLIKDIKCGPRFEDNQRNPMLAMMYAFSVASCLPSAMSSEGAMALGTVGFHPGMAEQISTEAGFTSFQLHDLRSDPVHYYYEIRH